MASDKTPEDPDVDPPQMPMRTVAGEVLPIPKPPGALALAAVPKPAKRKKGGKTDAAKAKSDFGDA